VASNLVSKKEFAELQGWSPSYVSRLVKDGRLVFEGEQIRVKESLELIDLTKGNRGDVAKRHADSRKGAANSPEQEEVKAANRMKALAESRSAQAKADKEEMERDQLAGNLLAREDVEAAFKFIGASLRGLLDVFPDQVAPLVAPIQTLDGCHAMLSDQCRNVLVSLGDAIEKQQKLLLEKKDAS
jgi:phage terminase Nu1 subunit (DNA packaging protein)